MTKLTNGWQDISTAPQKGLLLLLLGETIPDLADIRAGSYINEDYCVQLGEFDYPDGGWLIWNSGNDWFVVDRSSPLGWAYPPAISLEQGEKP
jgi:hypothetical protein